MHILPVLRYWRAALVTLTIVFAVVFGNASVHLR